MYGQAWYNYNHYQLPSLFADTKSSDDHELKEIKKESDDVHTAPTSSLVQPRKEPARTSL